MVDHSVTISLDLKDFYVADDKRVVRSGTNHLIYLPKEWGFKSGDLLKIAVIKTGEGKPSAGRVGRTPAFLTPKGDEGLLNGMAKEYKRTKDIVILNRMIEEYGEERVKEVLRD